VSWRSLLQTTVAVSTIEAEYMAVTEAVKEAIWLRGMVGDLGISQDSVEVHCDSQSALQKTISFLLLRDFSPRWRLLGFGSKRANYRSGRHVEKSRHVDRSTRREVSTRRLYADPDDPVQISVSFFKKGIPFGAVSFWGFLA